MICSGVDVHCEILPLNLVRLNSTNTHKTAIRAQQSQSQISWLRTINQQRKTHTCYFKKSFRLKRPNSPSLSIVSALEAPPVTLPTSLILPEPLCKFVLLNTIASYLVVRVLWANCLPAVLNAGDDSHINHNTTSMYIQYRFPVLSSAEAKGWLSVLFTLN